MGWGFRYNSDMKRLASDTRICFVLIGILLLPCFSHALTIYNPRNSRRSFDPRDSRKIDKWGMSKKQVMAQEKSPLIQNEGDLLIYRVMRFGEPWLLEYRFEKDKLIATRFRFLTKFSDKNMYLSYYDLMQAMLSMKHFAKRAQTRESWRRGKKELYGPDQLGTAVARGRLGQGRLEDVQVIYRQEPKTRGGNHFGSRLVFARDGTLFVTQGDRFNHRQAAQDLSVGFGKVMRINPDGSVPPDNPFVGRAGAQPQIWSYGHRNVQSAALHPETGQLWTVEHGARGGDELNHPEASKNYGWPVITYGVDYSFLRIGEGTAKPGMEQPVLETLKQG